MSDTEIIHDVIPTLAAIWDPVLDLRTWSTLAGFSYSTGKGEIAAGRGPKITRQSRGRVGVRLSHHYEWINGKVER
jgi:hypothetical protein